MKPTSTRDMRMDVRAALGADVDDFDVPKIVEEIHAEHGLIDVDEIPPTAFWRVVMRHDITAETEPVIEPEPYCGLMARFYLTPAGGTPQQVTKADWVAAETAAGFFGGRYGEPSTGGFGNGSISGSIETVKVAAKTEDA